MRIMWAQLCDSVLHKVGAQKAESRVFKDFKCPKFYQSQKNSSQHKN